MATETHPETVTRRRLNLYRRWMRDHWLGALPAVPLAVGVAVLVIIVMGASLPAWFVLATMFVIIASAIWPFSSLAALAVALGTILLWPGSSESVGVAWLFVALMFVGGSAWVFGAVVGVLGRASHHAVAWLSRQAQSWPSRASSASSTVPS